MTGTLSRHLLLVLIGLIVPSLAAADWPEFRGPTGQGHADATNLPTEWSTTRNVAWRQAIPGKGWSSPVLYGGRLFLTTAVPASGGDDEGPQVLRVLCIDPTDGKIHWDREVFRHGETAIHGKNSHASPTPICDRDQVYVHFGTHGTARLDHSGKVVWKTKTLIYEPQHGNGGSPALGKDALFINCDGADRQFIAALDRENGKEIWRTTRPSSSANGFSFSTPLVIEAAGRTQVISPASNFVLSYDPKTGDEIWRVEYPDGYSVVPRPLYSHGLVFACSGFATPSLFAIRPDGTGDVTQTHVAWKTSRGVPHTPAPVIVDDLIYFVSDKGVASCRSVTDGTQIWRERIGGNHSAAPIYADGKIYFLSEAGETTVIAPGKEFRQLAKSDLEERTLASYAVGDGALFIRTLTKLYRIEKR